MERDNSKIYIPLSTAQKYFVGQDTVHAWAFKADPEKMGDAQKEAEALMRRSHRGITDFKIENIGQEILRVRREIDKLIVNWNVVLASIAGTADVANTGNVAGDEVVQLYVHQKAGSDSRPMRELKGFERTALQPGEEKTVIFRLGADDLGYWSTSVGKWIQDAEAFDVWVGSDSLATLHADLAVVR